MIFLIFVSLYFKGVILAPNNKYSIWDKVKAVFHKFYLVHSWILRPIYYFFSKILIKNWFWCQSQKFRNIHRKLFSKVAGLKAWQLHCKETPTQVFSCEYCEIFENRFYTTPPVAAFVNLFFFLTMRWGNINTKLHLLMLYCFILANTWNITNINVFYFLPSIFIFQIFFLIFHVKWLSWVRSFMLFCDYIFWKSPKSTHSQN